MKRAVLVMLSGLVAALSPLAAAPAHAQTTTTRPGYPPGACLTPTGTQNAGARSVGETFTITLAPTCAFTGTVTVSVNGVAVGTKAPTAGAVSVSITVVSPTLLSVDDPVLVPITCGVPIAVVATGTSGNTTVTQTAVFTVLCPSVDGAVVGPPGPPGPPGQQQQQQQQQQLPGGQTVVPVAVPTGVVAQPTGGSRLAFTGGNALLLGVAAFALVAVGSALALVKQQQTRGRPTRA